MWSLWCTSACLNCPSIYSENTSSIPDSPFFLHQLLAVGTIQFNFRAECHGGVACHHEPAEDSWHQLDIHQLMPHLDRSEHSLPGSEEAGPGTTLCESLEYLLQHQFLQATYQEFDNVVTIRIYLVPEELRDMHMTPTLEARTHLQTLFARISQSPGTWDGFGGGCDGNPLIPLLEGNNTLAALYTDLPSPTPQGFNKISYRLLSHGDCLADFGFKSNLYMYQRKSVASMVEKELDISVVPNPLFMSMHAFKPLELSPTRWYFQPGIFEILRDCPKVEPCRGGILCEELGTGKTIMTLGLIMATLHQLSSPEPSTTDDRIVLTPFSFRHSPSKECVAARARLNYNKYGHNSTANRLPTLVELLIDNWRKNPSFPYPRGLDALMKTPSFKNDMNSIIQANVPFYYHYSNPADSPKKMYLTTATLIVVPDILIGQWAGEIKKHLEKPLRVCVLESRYIATPTVHQLASDYDIILITLRRFCLELKGEKREHTTYRHRHHLTPCECPEFSERIRVPKCSVSCQNRVRVSPFLQIRWKRLVFDEGNIVHSDNSERVLFAMNLSVERRWIVTGTPTTNLRGVKFGSGDKSSESGEIQVDRPTQLLTRRIWSITDREDLRKLGKMVTSFLAAPQFKRDPRIKLLTAQLINPLLDCRGPRIGSIQILKQFMQSFMIRHRVEDVEREVLLEPCTKEVVLLDLEPCAARSFNVLQAILVINAIDSQRHGSDYMFNKKNEKALNETVKNMWQLLFWRADEDKYNANDTLSCAEHFRANAKSRNVSKEDKSALEEALGHLKAAWNDVNWKETQMDIDMPYRVFNIDKTILDSWSWIYDYAGTGENFVHLDHLNGLRDTIARRPLISIDELKQAGFEFTRPLAPPESTDSVLLAQSPFVRTRIGSSGSSKLNYILDEVLKHSAEEKFLIFSDANITPLSLDYVADGLDLARIKFLRLTTTVRPLDREHMVITFETSQEYRVLLVDLRAAARGLNLVSASRIIFCEPVWEADLEIQAIKRAHRIGQTRPVTVKTLAIRGTAEENMITHIANRNTQEKIPANVQDEPGMKDFIANPKYINIPPTNLSRINFPLFRFPDQVTSLPQSPPRSIIPARLTTTNAQQVASPPPKKRRKTIHFALD